MLTLSRWLADSNRRKRFCRPVTKPLIQTTRRIPLLNSSAKLQHFFLPPNIFGENLQNIFLHSPTLQTERTIVQQVRRYNLTLLLCVIFFTKVSIHLDQGCCKTSQRCERKDKDKEPQVAQLLLQPPCDHTWKEHRERHKSGTEGIVGSL